MLVAGSTLTAVHELISKTSDIVINWDGGRYVLLLLKLITYMYI